MADVEKIVLSRILSMQNVIHAAPDSAWLGGALTKTLLDIPGLHASALYLGHSLIAHAEKKGVEYQWPASDETIEKTLILPERFVTNRIPLQTSIKVYGSLIIVANDENLIEAYLPTIANTLNTVSLVIENKEQHQELQSFANNLQKQVNDQVQEIEVNRAQLRQLFDEAVCGIALGDPKTGILTDCNNAFCELLKRDKSEIIGKHQSTFHVAEEQTETFSKTFKEHISDKDGQTLNSKMVTATGEVIEVEIRAKLLNLADKPLVQAFFTNITARKRAEEALATSEEKYRRFFTTVSNGWAYFKIITDENNIPIDYIFLEINPAYEKLTGLTRKQVIGRKVTEIFPSVTNDLIDWIAVCGDIALNGGSTTFETFSMIISEWINISITSPSKGYFIVVVDNISDRKKAEEERIKSERHLQRVINYSPVPLVITNQNDEIEYFNRKFIEIFGYSLEDIPTIEKWWLRAFPEPVHRKDIQHSWEEAIAKAVSKKAPVETQTWDIVCKDGSLRWVEIDLMQLGDKSLLSLNDITKHKHAEQEREDLISLLKTKTEEQERFIYTVSHDLKSPLVSISTFTGLIEEDLNNGNQEGVGKSLVVIKNAAKRMKSLLEDLLEISRIGIKKAPPEQVNLGKLINTAIKNITGLISECGTTINIDPELPDIFVDKQSFLQVLENLLSNAVKYSRDAKGGSVVNIGTFHKENESVCYIRDNGIGIESKHRDKVFDLFERLDPHFEGTGVGLTIVKQIVEAHGCRIWIESEGINQGTTFYFTLPQEKVA